MIGTFTTQYDLVKEDSPSSDGTGGFNSNPGETTQKTLRGTPPIPMSTERKAQMGRELTDELVTIYFRFRSVKDQFDPESRYYLDENNRQGRRFIVHTSEDVRGQRHYMKVTASEEK